MRKPRSYTQLKLDRIEAKNPIAVTEEEWQHVAAGWLKEDEYEAQQQG